jgi:hypothetical protein
VKGHKSREGLKSICYCHLELHASKREPRTILRLATLVLPYKLMRKCKKYQVLARAITMAEKCVEGISMSWVPFSLNQFLIDYVEAHDRGMEFHYPWLLIMIVFTTWEELEDA